MPARGGKWYGSSWIRKSRRLAIYARDGWRCAYCAATEHLSLDHLWPPVDGVYDHRSVALTTCCLACNNRRSGRSLRAWLKVLRAGGRDVGAIVRELRRRAAAAVDQAAGRALEADAKVRRAGRAAGSYFRREEWPALDQKGSGSSDDDIPF